MWLSSTETPQTVVMNQQNSADFYDVDRPTVLRKSDKYSLRSLRQPTIRLGYDSARRRPPLWGLALLSVRGFLSKKERLAYSANIVNLADHTLHRALLLDCSRVCLMILCSDQLLKTHRPRLQRVMLVSFPFPLSQEDNVPQSLLAFCCHPFLLKTRVLDNLGCGRERTKMEIPFILSSNQNENRVYVRVLW